MIFISTPSFSFLQFYRIESKYIKSIEDRSGQVIKEIFDDDTIESYALEKIGNSLKVRTNTKYLAGLSQDGFTLVAWFNNQLYHAAPISLNLLYNALLNAQLGWDSSPASIHFYNFPLPFRDESYQALEKMGYELGSQMSLIIPFAMAYVIAIFVIFYIRERATKAKLILFISGVDTLTYWLTSYIFDIFVYILLCLVFYITLLGFQQDGWVITEILGAVVVILLLFGLSAIALTMLLSNLFQHAPAGYTALVIFYALVGEYFLILKKCLFRKKIK